MSPIRIVSSKRGNMIVSMPIINHITSPGHFNLKNLHKSHFYITMSHVVLKYFFLIYIKSYLEERELIPISNIPNRHRKYRNFLTSILFSPLSRRMQRQVQWPFEKGHCRRSREFFDDRSWKLRRWSRIITRLPWRPSSRIAVLPHAIAR